MPDAPASGRLRVSVLAGAVVLLLAGLGMVDVWRPDEPRYIQVAEELRSFVHGPSGLVVLHLNDAVYDQKPPLYYWLAALAGAPFGRVTEFAGRLPSALAGIAVVGLTLAFGTRLLGGRAGLLGSALLLTVFQFARHARRVQLDVLLTLLETAALVLFWRLDRGLGPRGLQLAAMHAALGLAVLTKGPVGFLVPLLVIVFYLLWERRLRELPRFLPPWGLALSLGPGLLWLAAAALFAEQGFDADSLGYNLLARFFGGGSHERPFHYFLWNFPIQFLPWTLLWPFVFLAGRRVLAGDLRPGDREAESTRRAWRFLLAWVGASLVFFSLSSGKRGIYLLPVAPAAALLCGDALVRQLAGRADPPRALGVALGVFAALLGLAALEVLIGGAFGRALVIPADALAQLHGPLLVAFGLAVIGCLAGGCAGWLVLGRHRAGLLIRFGVPVATVFAIELAVFLLLFPALDPSRSPRPVARAAVAASPPDRPIGLLFDRMMTGGLVYYGGRRVEELNTPESVNRFLDAGAGAIVVKARKLERLEAVTPVEIVSRARAGRREVLVVVPSSAHVGEESHGAARRRSAP